MADPGLVIAGPTASGKTALSIRVAKQLDGEIVSVDSRQVYKGMDIGTAKATPGERRSVPHHGLDLVDPDERYSAGRFAREARGWIEGIRGRGRIPVLAGGTGFFLRALLQPLFREPDLDPERRERLRRYLESCPDHVLRRWLVGLDPVSAQRLAEGGGRQRVLRALEIVLLTGRPLHWWHSAAPPDQPPLDAVVFVLDLPRQLLYDRINRRVHIMMEMGLVDEVRSLLRQGYRPDDPGMSATGYPEVVAYLDGRLELDQVVDRIKRATRRYARRQLTWFRNQLPPGATWVDATLPLDEMTNQVVRQWQSES